MDYKVKCHKCKKLLSTDHYDIKSSGEYYTTCKICRPITNKQSLQSFHRNKQTLCNICNKNLSSKKSLKAHLWGVHDIGSGNWFNCDKCDYKCKTNGDLKSHLWNIHSEGGKWFNCDKCDYKSKTNGTLKSHIWNIHSEGGKWFNCDKCDYKSKTNSHLKEHLRNIHNIDVVWFNCDKCDYKSKANGALKTHKKLIHNIDVLWFNCDKCDYNCKTNNSLKLHLRNIHNIDVEWFKCNECDYKSKNNSHLKDHMWNIHNLGDAKWFNCDKCVYKCKANGVLKSHKKNMHNVDVVWFNCDKCDYKCKTNGHLKMHLRNIHNIDVEWFYCNVCDYKCKSNSSLKTHLTNVHDIGDKECEICYKNVYSLTKYHDIIDNKTSNICRKCYNKVTGYTSRAEKQMVEFLKTNENISPYIILEDTIIRGEQCSTKRRPDLLISSSNKLYILVECDENQHNGYDVSCEDGRLDEIFDELKGGRIVVIRWNPDYYKTNNKRGNVKREDRLNRLKDVIIEHSNKKYDIGDNIKVIYMYYSDDSKVITNRFKKEFIV